ncbi:MAG: 5'/3'-nucleotidase SurE [Novosphingobium sp.]
MSKGMRILITNDDGIDSEGIHLLERVALQFSDDVWVVAPDGERSGAGHAISISHPIRIRKRDDRHFAVQGTPTDCALLGIHELIAGKQPDVVLSGVNRGPNLAEDVTYSGTCSAAMEGAVLGIPAIALSQFYRYQGQLHWPTAERYAPVVLEQLLNMDWQHGQFVNVNFPECPPEDVKGIRVTRLGLRPGGSFRPVGRVDERHVPYWWIKINFPDGGHELENDLQAIRDNEVSVTPLRLDMTDYHGMERLRTLF